MNFFGIKIKTAPIVFAVACFLVIGFINYYTRARYNPKPFVQKICPTQKICVLEFSDYG
jgi:hypothetical protein|tara:strand:- start:264 stop:440 length:177 start_codon:yes stop_codon:yes gene_type:complete